MNGGRIRRFQAEGTVRANFIIGAESVQDSEQKPVWPSLLAGRKVLGHEVMTILIFIFILGAVTLILITAVLQWQY